MTTRVRVRLAVAASACALLAALGAAAADASIPDASGVMHGGWSQVKNQQDPEI